MFKQAAFLKAVILYFTGHGNDQNALVLDDGRSVSQRAVFNWVDERPKIAGRAIPVFIIFYFYQPYRFPTPLPSHKLADVCVIWGCRRGETSQDMNLGDDVPYSDLLKSICLALYEAEPCPFGSLGEFMGRVATHVSCLMKIHRAGVCGRRRCVVPWNECRCFKCRKGLLCEHTRHDKNDSMPIQTPVVWSSMFENDTSAGDQLDAFQSILVHVREPIRKVAEELIADKWCSRFMP